MVPGDEVIWQNDIAVRNGRMLAAKSVDVTLFNFSVWAWPQYARVAAQFCPQPIVMFSNVNPRSPGLVGMLANSGSLDQSGIRFTKSFGDISDPGVRARLKSQIRAVGSARRLRGLTYCLLGGRSLGIDTTVIDPAQWMKQFGVDVDHVDQLELVRRAEQELADGARVRPALEYLKDHLRKIHWTEPSGLSPHRGLTQEATGPVLCDTESDRGLSLRFLRNQRPAGTHRALRDGRRSGGLPKRSLRTRWISKAFDRLLHGGGLRRRPDHANLQTFDTDPGSVRGRPSLS